MTLSSIAQGDVVTVRVYKVYSGFAWANNYEVQATQDLPNAVFILQQLSDRFVALERSLHLLAVIIDRVTISTYAPDSLPYNPENLATYSYNQSGQRSAGGDFVPLEACLFVRRITDLGRSGRILYRGCLTESDVVAPNFRGGIISSSANFFRNAINSWSQVGLGEQWRLVMASGNPNPTNIRPVSRLEVSDRLVFKKLNNRYFRRRP
jgi:hypothetical protein